jgi:hypothetical protein
MWWFQSREAWAAVVQWRHSVRAGWLEDLGWPIIREPLPEHEVLRKGEVAREWYYQKAEW